jgi:hypothetical protein
VGGGGQQRCPSNYGLGGGSFERGFIAGEVRGGLGEGAVGPRRDTWRPMSRVACDPWASLLFYLLLNLVLIRYKKFKTNNIIYLYVLP